MSLSPLTPESILLTVLYSTLLLWGMWVGVRQVYQGFFRRSYLASRSDMHEFAGILFKVRPGNADHLFHAIHGYFEPAVL